MVAVVISIGIGVQGMTHSATTIMRIDYFDKVMDSVYNIKERFRIENIAVNITSASSLQLWVVNFGDYKVNITTIKVSGGGNESYYYPPDNNVNVAPNGVVLSPGEFERFDIEEGTVKFWKGIVVSVRVENERENKAYETIQIP